MKKETVPAKITKNADQAARERSVFLVAALNMSWQLAVVVLLPVLGGRALDGRSHSSPLWTLVGFVVAVLAAGMIVWRQAQAVTPKLTKASGHKESRR
jgi:F0F1-type ATP synthase assembly protein I